MSLLRTLRQKELQRWALGYARHLLHRARQPRAMGVRHLLFAICDHYEPVWGDASHEVAQQRVKTWLDAYPVLAREFVDSDGHHPRHSFFFPGEQYAPSHLDALGEIARAGLGEVELHLHHDGDTEPKLKSDIEQYLSRYAEHGHLTRDPDGRLRYAFIHGNWCLANARDDGRFCGVDAEIPLLYQTGCYADFTFPSAPDQCQPDIVNQIYWPSGDLAQRRAYEHGERARVGERKHDRILMIQGPLALARRPGSLRLRIEGAALTANDPATPARIATWVQQGIHVAGRPEWVFVKVHTHGAPEAQARALLGKPARLMHEELSRRYNDGTNWRLHYVSAREMFNIAFAAMEQRTGNPGQYRDYLLPPPPVARSSHNRQRHIHDEPVRSFI